LLKILLLNPLWLKIHYVELVMDKLTMDGLSAIKTTALELQKLFPKGFGAQNRRGIQNESEKIY
jgi:hypothetical protein